MSSEEKEISGSNGKSPYWVGRTRTFGCKDQNLVPYRLATTQNGRGWVLGLEPRISRATIWRPNQLDHTHHKRACRDSNPGHAA